MTDSELGERASRLMEEALASAAMSDPRPLYRELLRELKTGGGESFTEASQRYQSAVLPSIAVDGADPLSEWIGYGRWLAERCRSGKFVSVDATGRATDAPDVHPPSAVLLHIPAEAKLPAYLLASPARPSPAQRATLELLVRPAAGPS
ncbi:MAG: hypothetical protein ABFS14_06980 [Gemmatimonadota bacterium]